MLLVNREVELVGAPVALLLKEGLPVLEGEAPAVREAVCEALVVLEAVSVLLGVCAGVLLDDPVGVPVGVCVCVGVGVVETDAAMVEDLVAVGDLVGVLEREVPLLGVTVADKLKIAGQVSWRRR